MIIEQEAFMRRTSLIVLAGLLMTGALGCSSEAARTSGASTLPPLATTTTPTDASSTTTVVVVPAGWQSVDQQTLTGIIAPPCCGASWFGSPSPSFPDDPSLPLADGVYLLDTTWATDPAQPLVGTVARFESCTGTPAGTCEEDFPDSLYVVEADRRPVSLPLDGHVRVVLFGFTGIETVSPAAIGNGADLAELATALNAAHAALFEVPLAAGQTPEQIVTAVRANPSSGFGPSNDGSDFSVAYTYGDAPPLLWQGPFRSRTEAGVGTDLLRVVSLEVVDGVPTIYVYAGFYS